MNILASKQFISLSGKPGQTGSFFYQKGFSFFSLDANYSALLCNSNVQFQSILQKLQFAGISVSMPFKRTAFSLSSVRDKSAIDAECVNTLVLKNGTYHGYSTDIDGVDWLINEIIVGDVAILGNGAIGTMLSKRLTQIQKPFSIFSRSLNNWHQRHGNFDTIINCTALGTMTSESPLNSVKERCVVVDLPLKRGNLENVVSKSNATYIPGIDFYSRVFRSQFRIYTNLEAPIDLVNKWKEEWVHSNV